MAATEHAAGSRFHVLVHQAAVPGRWSDATKRGQATVRAAEEGRRRALHRAHGLFFVAALPLFFQAEMNVPLEFKLRFQHPFFSGRTAKPFCRLSF